MKAIVTGSGGLIGSECVRLLCERGWEVVRLAPDPAAGGPSSDDLEALADAVREAARPRPDVVRSATPPGVGRRGHLRVLRPTDA